VPAGSAGGPAATGDRLGWTVGLAYGQFNTDVILSHRETAPNTLEQQMVVATLSRGIGGGWSLTGVGGVILGGTLRELPDKAGPDAVTLASPVSPGGLIGVSFDKTWVAETAFTPFVSTSLRVAASYIPSVGDSAFMAIDLRAAVTVGKTIGDVFTPYLSARVFGGPILWFREDGTSMGTDIYHAQVAIGASFHIPLGDAATLTATVDWSPVLERSLSAGAAVSF